MHRAAFSRHTSWYHIDGDFWRVGFSSVTTIIFSHHARQKQHWYPLPEGLGLAIVHAQNHGSTGAYAPRNSAALHSQAIPRMGSFVSILQQQVAPATVAPPHA